MNILHSQLASGVRLLNLSGPLNTSLAEEVMQTFSDLSDQGIERVVINLEDVPVIDSQGPDRQPQLPPRSSPCVPQPVNCS